MKGSTRALGDMQGQVNRQRTLDPSVLSSTSLQSLRGHLGGL